MEQLGRIAHEFSCVNVFAPIRSFSMRAISCASFRKCRSFSLLPWAFAPLVEGRT